MLLGMAVFAARSFYYPDYLGYARTGGLDVALATGILAGLAPWMRHRAVRAACVIPAGALFVYASMPGLPWDGSATIGRMAVFLVVLAALACWRGRGARPPGSWAALVCATPVLVMVPWLHLLDSDSYGPVEPYWYTAALLVAVAACWLATDARPAFGVVFAMVLSYSLTIVTNLTSPGALFYTLTSVDPWNASLARGYFDRERETHGADCGHPRGSGMRSRSNSVAVTLGTMALPSYGGRYSRILSEEPVGSHDKNMRK